MNDGVQLKIIVFFLYLLISLCYILFVLDGHLFEEFLVIYSSVLGILLEYFKELSFIEVSTVTELTEGEGFCHENDSLFEILIINFGFLAKERSERGDKIILFSLLPSVA